MSINSHRSTCTHTQEYMYEQGHAVKMHRDTYMNITKNINKHRRNYISKCEYIYIYTHTRT